MKKSLCLFSFLLLLAAALAAPQNPRRPGDLEEKDSRPQGQAAIRVEVQQVQVDVTVQDKKGNLVVGLGKENFTLYEDKVQQEIATFTPIEAPMTVVLVTEYSKVLPWEMLAEAWYGSRIFMEQLRPDDWVAVVAYDMRPEILVDFTQNKAEAYNALRRLNFPAFSESNLYDTVYDVLDRIEEMEGKVALVLLTSGLDTFSKKNLGETLNKVKKTHAVIYSVSLGGNLRARADHLMNTNTRMSLLQADAVLKEFAKLTGGQAFAPRFVQQFPGIFETISALVRHQYSLGYVPSNPRKDGKFRKIQVEVKADVDGDGKPDKLKVSHRSGYLASETN